MEGENFREFCGFVPIRESFLCKIWGCGILWHGMSEQSAKVFSAKSVFSPICKSFLPRKFPTIRYFLTHYLACATTIVCGYLLERTTQMVSTSFSLRATFRAPSRSQLSPPCSREDSHWCASMEHLCGRRIREWYS